MKKRKNPPRRMAPLTDEQRHALQRIHREAAEIVADMAAASAARVSASIRENIERRQIQAKAYV